MSANDTLHHGMTKRQLAQHICDFRAGMHAGHSVATPFSHVRKWTRDEIEATHAEYHASQHLKDEARKAVALLGLEEGTA